MIKKSRVKVFIFEGKKNNYEPSYRYFLGSSDTKLD